jgi:hypothetical protein
VYSNHIEIASNGTVELKEVLVPEVWHLSLHQREFLLLGASIHFPLQHLVFQVFQTFREGRREYHPQNCLQKPSYAIIVVFREKNGRRLVDQYK